jgi:D-hexose-6-phosphate mutarotase
LHFSDPHAHRHIQETFVNTRIQTLNERFAISNCLKFQNTRSGLPVAEITTPQGSASVAIQGGQVLAWQPAGQSPVIWLSKAAVFESGKSVRGGVPVCWPWFGAKEGQTAHGFVRTRLWEVRETLHNSEGQVVLHLGIADDEATRAVWNFAFDLELVVTVGASLSMELITRNTGHEPFIFTEALHTYFCIGDIGKTRVLGLDGTDYLDKVNQFAQSRQIGAIAFTGETDRIYFNTQADCLIEDLSQRRVIRISKTGSSASVVWNPWIEREKSFADMASGEYQGMVCVETANAGPHQISLAPGATHAMTACIAVV